MTQYTISSTEPISSDRMTKVFGAELARGRSIDFRDVDAELPPSSVNKDRQGWGLIRRLDSTWLHAAARIVDSLINRNGRRASGIRVDQNFGCNTSLRSATALTDNGGLSVGAPVDQIVEQLPPVLTTADWFNAQIAGWTRGQFPGDIALIDTVSEVVISLPWPVGATSVKTSAGTLSARTRSGLLLIAPGAGTYNVTASFPDAANATITYKIGSSGMQAMDITNFEANVNGNEVGGWGYAGFTFITTPGAEFGTVDGLPVLYSADNSQVLEPQPVGDMSLSRNTFYPRAALAENTQQATKQLVVNLYGVWAEV